MGDSQKDAEAKFGRRLAKGEVLFREGDPGDCMFVIQSGRIAIQKDLSGARQLLAVLEPGDFFGEMAVLNGHPRSATAEALEDAKVLEVNAKRFEAMLTGRSDIAVRLIKKLAARLEAANALLEERAKGDALGRIVLGLLRHGELHGKPQDGGGVLVPLDEAGLAKEVGTSLDDVGSAIMRLGRRMLVVLAPDGIFVTDMARLREFLECLDQSDER